MISPAYKRAYQDLFLKIRADMSEESYYESALLSYVHSNRLMSWLFWKRVETAMAIAGKLTNAAVLDFGCGPGVTLKFLQENNCRITACDNRFTHLAAETCLRFGIDAEICDDLSEIEDNTFDIIFALDVLEHIGRIDTVIDKLLALLKQNGCLVISGPTENLFYRIGRSLAGFSGHYHQRNIYDIEEVIMRKGLRNRVTRNMYFPIMLFRVSSWAWHM